MSIEVLKSSKIFLKIQKARSTCRLCMYVCARLCTYVQETPEQALTTLLWLILRFCTGRKYKLRQNFKW